MHSVRVFLLVFATWGLSFAARAEAPPLTGALPRLDGKPFDLSTLRGQVVLIDVWATWCAPCRQALPAYAALWRSLGQADFVVVAVSVDEEDDKVRAFLDEYPVPFVVLRDPEGRLPKRLRASGMPTTWLIGRDGQVRTQTQGYKASEIPVLKERVQGLLAEKPPLPAVP
jgi:peroxiredoxin